MKVNKRPTLVVEVLESREVPATIRFDGSNLFIYNPRVVAGASTLTVIQQANNSFQVKDGTANNGFYAVTGNIMVQGNNAKDNITVNVTAAGLPGNLSVATGNGASSVTVDGTAAGAFVAGNTRLNLGVGKGTVAVGSTTGLANKGTLAVSDRGAAASTLTVGGGGNKTVVGGATTISGFPTVTLGGAAADVFAGGVNLQNVGNSQAAVITLAATSKDLGNLTLWGGQGGTTVNLNGSVLGITALYLGNATNAVALGTGVNLGSLSYTGGNGANSLTAANATATVLGNATLNWGNGANSLGSTAGLVVNGNLLVNDGNGSLDGTTNAFQGQVAGNLNVNNGNGDNLFTLDVDGGANVGGNFTYNGGNGGNSVTINNTTLNTTVLNVRFGNGSANLVTLNAGSPGTGNLTGTITWGVPTTASGTNGFVDNGYVWQNNITLINVPA